jgi:hypothetical protein
MGALDRHGLDLDQHVGMGKTVDPTAERGRAAIVAPGRTLAMGAVLLRAIEREGALADDIVHHGARLLQRRFHAFVA